MRTSNDLNPAIHLPPKRISLSRSSTGKPVGKTHSWLSQVNQANVYHYVLVQGKTVIAAMLINVNINVFIKVTVVCLYKLSPIHLYRIIFNTNEWTPLNHIQTTHVTIYKQIHVLDIHKSTFLNPTTCINIRLKKKIRVSR
jgi:hypothetical protein